MMRLLYQCLLMLHPPEFRRRFSLEMLCIFDHATASKSNRALPLFFDAFVSLIRQWLLRSGSWRLPVAAVGLFAQLALGLFIARGHGGSARQNASAFEPTGLDKLMRIAHATACGLVLMVVAASLWDFVRRQGRGSRIGA